MKVLKKFICTVVAMFMTLAICACGAKPEASKTPETPAPPVPPDPAPGVEEVEIVHRERTVYAEVYRPDASYFPVVIFSHGYNGYKDDFKETAEYLRRSGIGSVTFTFCGSGARDRSGMPTTDMTLFTEKDDLLAVMDYVKTLKWFDGNLFLLGGSQGGMVSAMAAEDRPSEVKGMVLLFPGFSIPDDWNGRYPTDDTVPETIPWWGVDLGKNFVLTLRNLDIYEKMPSFEKPVLLMHGTKDAIVPISYSRRAAQTYPNAELVTYEGQEHGFSDGTMRDVNDCVLDFVNENL